MTDNCRGILTFLWEGKREEDAFTASNPCVFSRLENPLIWRQSIHLEDLNTKFFHYVDTTYNLHTHSSLQGLAPMDRYLKDKDHFKFVSSLEWLEYVSCGRLCAK